MVEVSAETLIDYLPAAGAPEWFAAHGRLIKALDDMNSTVQARLPVTVSIE